MKLNKSFITNFTAVLLIVLSYLFMELHKPLLYTGLFALSGAITNQLAIHMLFEKVPLLYGSGVIPARFESFKNAIKNLMMAEFLLVNNLRIFLQVKRKKSTLSLS